MIREIESLNLEQEFIIGFVESVDNCGQLLK
jgi:hypothetical protein